MTDFHVAEVARVCGGTLEGQGGEARIGKVTIDSREIEPGDLFVALPGTRTDGHAFVRQAMERGAAAAIVAPHADRLPSEFEERAQVRVKYPRKSLADLAAAHRQTLRCPVIAVTGSNGKSSTREMIARVLEPLGPVVQSPKSFNNELGVPLTILGADQDTSALVVEMGTSRRGEIRHLAGITRPDVGVVTNVGAAHLEGLGDEEGVAREKGALAAALRPRDALVLNADDPRVVQMAHRTQAERVVTYSMHRSTATVWGHRPRRTARGVATYLFGKARLFLPVAGMHNVSNALAAVSVGLMHGLTADEIRAGLRRVRLPQMRMQRMTFSGVTVFLDCYNANPASFVSALDEVSARAKTRRRVLVAGDMLELGPRAPDLHYEMGTRIPGHADVLWAVGREARALYEGALDAGLHPDQAFWSPTAEHAIADPSVQLTRGDMVLFKASRGMRLERLADALRRGIAREKSAKNRAAKGNADPKQRKVG